MSARKPAAKSKAKPSTAVTTDEPAVPLSDMVSCILGPNTTVGGLMVGNARIEANRSGVIPRGEFDRLQAVYDLREVKG